LGWIGNHDYWVHGNPRAAESEDQLANGFMQFYGQDTVGSSSHPLSPSPYNFRVDPDRTNMTSLRKPLPENFFFYHTIGNTGKKKIKRKKEIKRKREREKRD